jgi:hypothetical protein
LKRNSTAKMSGLSLEQVDHGRAAKQDPSRLGQQHLLPRRAPVRPKSRHAHENPAANAACARLIAEVPADATLVSIGGGPTRSHPDLGPFANVDVVADAYRLPYADASVRRHRLPGRTRAPGRSACSHHRNAPGVEARGHVSVEK